MSPNDPNLTDLLGSRICHDLISPLGAISNGVELMRMCSAAQGPELDLIAESVENANARIRYFRVAFGAASPDQSVSAAETRTILADVGRGGRLTIRWRPDGATARNELKLVFLLLQCLEHAMPRGGEISVDRPGTAWRIVARSDRMQFDTALWSLLERPAADCSPSAAEVQFLLAPAVAAELGRPLRVTRGEGEVVVVC